MNTQTAAVVILLGLTVVFWPAPVTPLTFEQRWEPVKSMPPMIDRSPRPLTFEERWEPVRRLPPMIRINDVGPRVIPVSEKKLDRLIPLPDPIPEVRVKTIKFGPLAEISETASEDTPPPLPRLRPGAAPHLPPPARARARILRKASLDICARHGMRRVDYGRTWRCRR